MFENVEKKRDVEAVTREWQAKGIANDISDTLPARVRLQATALDEPRLDLYSGHEACNFRKGARYSAFTATDVDDPAVYAMTVSEEEAEHASAASDRIVAPAAPRLATHGTRLW